MYCIALCYDTIRCVKLCHVTLYCNALHCVVLRCVSSGVRFVSLRYCITLYCIVLSCAALPCIMLRYVMLRCIALQCFLLIFISTRFVWSSIFSSFFTAQISTSASQALSSVTTMPRVLTRQALSVVFASQVTQEMVQSAMVRYRDYIGVALNDNILISVGVVFYYIFLSHMPIKGQTNRMCDFSARCYFACSAFQQNLV